MTTSNPMAGDGIRPDAAEAISVALTPDHARRAADFFFCKMTGALEGWEIESREDFDRIRGVLAHYAERLEQVAWGEPSTDVTLRLPSSEIQTIAEYMAERDGGFGAYNLERLRRIVGDAEGAIAILEQLEATR